MSRLLLLLTFLALLVGCDNRPSLAQVSGLVLLDGAPLAEIVVEFLPDPDKDTHGPRSTATTNSEGRFQLLCDDGHPGAVIGVHRVVLQDPRSFPPPRPRPGVSTAVSPSRVRDTYRNATTTPLRQEVKPGEQTLKIEITSK